MASTPGLLFLKTKGVEVSLHPYAYDPSAEAVGLAAAAALGLDAALTLKTLMVEVDGTPACCVIPSDRQLSMKKVAAAFGGKAAAMMLREFGRASQRRARRDLCRGAACAACRRARQRRGGRAPARRGPADVSQVGRARALKASFLENRLCFELSNST